MPLSLSLLGSFQVARGGNAITQFGYDKVRALLAFLAVEANRPLRREQIEALLWQDQAPSAAQHSLSQALLKLRRALNDSQRAPTFLRAQRGILEFQLTADDWLDTREFTNALDLSEHHAHADLKTCAECTARLQRAVEMYRGDFLEGLLIGDSAAFEDWAIAQREHYRRRVLRALEHLTHCFMDAAQYAQAELYARRQVEIEPYFEEAHRALINILAHSGKRSAALAQYENCRRLLAQELGVEPSHETRALYERLRAAGESRPHNLPLPLTPLFGRAREMQQLTAQLAQPECRLLTLVGPGGIGKTTLALHAAQANLAAFLDGTFFVSLVAVDEPAQLASAIVRALALGLRGDGDAKTQLLEHLRAKTMLLLLDNFEPLLSDARESVAQDFMVELLRAAPHVKFLVTSRAPLSLRVEWVVRVQGLSLSETDSRAPAAGDYDARQLFLERARRVSAAFVPSAQDEIEIARICRLLWGSPLGIELAAGWMSAWSCRAIADEIERDIDFLHTSARDVPARHRSLRAVFEQSYRLLSAREQNALRRLAVFHNPFTRAAAFAVANANAYQLTALVHKSLLHLASSERYALHPLLKQFLAETLAADAPAQRETRAKHADYFGKLVGSLAEQTLATGQAVDANREVASIAADLDSALLFAVNTREAEFVTRLLKDLWDYYAGVGQYRAAETLFTQVVAMLPRENMNANQRQIRAHARATLGACQMRVGAYEKAQMNLEAALALLRELEDASALAFCLMSLSNIAIDKGDFARARELAGEGQRLRHTLPNPNDAAFALYHLGLIELAAGALAQAHAYYSHGLEIAHALGHTTMLSIAIPLDALGIVAYRRGEPQTAQALHKASLEIARAIHHRWQTADSLSELARLDIDAGNYGEAARALQEAAQIYIEIDKHAESALAIRNRAWLEEARENFAAARALYLESQTILERARTSVPLAFVRADMARLLGRAGETTDAEFWLHRAEENPAALRVPYVFVGVETGKGIVERARGNFARAREHSLIAFETALEHQEKYEALRTLYELAELLNAQRDENTFAILDCLAQHPAAPHHLRVRARTMRDARNATFETAVSLHAARDLNTILGLLKPPEE